MPAPMIPYRLPPIDPAVARSEAAAFARRMRERRSCRYFSDRPVPRELIVEMVRAAHAAPSGANRQPWRFVAVDDPAIKREIRIAAEAEERESYAHRMPPEWLEALEPIGTDANKPFLEIAPWLIVLFRIDFEIAADGRRLKTYYPAESCGIAAGMLLTAAHLAGLATLTHTPSPMQFLRSILNRPENERPYLLIPVGYPADDCTVPDLPRKPLHDVLIFNR
ncbi:MAG: nitroreductase family protein [Phycisphaerae bacterium]|nr:nitroreductase family protein [Phycisphaerae bacterium]